jgi:hypothetical protein
MDTDAQEWSLRNSALGLNSYPCRRSDGAWALLSRTVKRYARDRQRFIRDKYRSRNPVSFHVEPRQGALSRALSWWA